MLQEQVLNILARSFPHEEKALLRKTSESIMHIVMQDDSTVPRARKQAKRSRSDTQHSQRSTSMSMSSPQQRTDATPHRLASAEPAHAEPSPRLSHVSAPEDVQAARANRLRQGDEESLEERRKSKIPQKWTPEEDEQLRQAVDKIGAHKWKTVATLVEGRDHVQCLQRWNKVLQPGLVKGPWTPSEDDLLRQLVLDEKITVWKAVAARVPGRTPKQCRERWKLSLDPAINHTPFTLQEDEKLEKLHRELGNRWAEIRRHFAGRTENAVKTRLKSIMRSRAREWSPEQDANLLRYYETYGKDIRAIATYFPGRTKTTIRLRIKQLTETTPFALESVSSESPKRQHQQHQQHQHQQPGLQASLQRQQQQSSSEPAESETFLGEASQTVGVAHPVAARLGANYEGMSATPTAHDLALAASMFGTGGPSPHPSAPAASRLDQHASTAHTSLCFAVSPATLASRGSAEQAPSGARSAAVAAAAAAAATAPNASSLASSAEAHHYLSKISSDSITAFSSSPSTTSESDQYQSASAAQLGGKPNQTAKRDDQRTGQPFFDENSVQVNLAHRVASDASCRDNAPQHKIKRRALGLSVVTNAPAIDRHARVAPGTSSPWNMSMILAKPTPRQQTTFTPVAIHAACRGANFDHPFSSTTPISVTPVGATHLASSLESAPVSRPGSALANVYGAASVARPLVTTACDASPDESSRTSVISFSPHDPSSHPEGENAGFADFETYSNPARSTVSQAAPRDAIANFPSNMQSPASCLSAGNLLLTSRAHKTVFEF